MKALKVRLMHGARLDASDLSGGRNDGLGT